jgi:hypothetical protein
MKSFNIKIELKFEKVYLIYIYIVYVIHNIHISLIVDYFIQLYPQLFYYYLLKKSVHPSLRPAPPPVVVF